MVGGSLDPRWAVVRSRVLVAKLLTSGLPGDFCDSRVFGPFDRRVCIRSVGMADLGTSWLEGTVNVAFSGNGEPGDCLLTGDRSIFELGRMSADPDPALNERVGLSWGTLPFEIWPMVVSAEHERFIKVGVKLELPAGGNPLLQVWLAVDELRERRVVYGAHLFAGVEEEVT